MKKIFVCFLVLFNLACVSAQTSRNNANPPNANVWNPQRTWVFMVGLLEWQNKDNFASFPQKNRRDKVLLDVWRARGVPENQILYLQDKSATTAKIQNEFEKFLSKTKTGDTLFVYYCGHGYKIENVETLLASYDANDKKGWKVATVPETIDRFFKGENAFIMLDNCYSGAMAEAVKKRNSKISYAVLASSHFNSFSTGNWTFTESLIYAFRGEPFIDEDANGKVSLGELAQNSTEDMLFAEEQLAQFAFTGKLNEQFVVAENKGKSAPRLGDRIEAFDQGGWYKAVITDVKDNKYKVHFYGYEYDEDAWRTAKEIREFKPKSYKVGAKVEAEWNEKWYPARILQVKGGAHLVSYDGFGSEWDEWIPSSRVRLKK